MVVAEGPKEYILYAQNDHGDLAGQFAAHWGNGEFAGLNPRQSMVFAVEAHDNGWWDWDINPSVDDQGVPITFRTTPRARLFPFINKGIDNILEKDLYAGLIVAMHHAGLPQHRYGTLPAVPKREDEHTVKFITEREAFYKELIERVGKMEEYAGVNSPEYLWFNYRMIQVFDRLSLFFCCNYDLQSAAPSGSPTKKEHESGTAYYGAVIKPAPTKFGQEDSEFRLRTVDRRKLVVDPYPFDVAPLKVSVRARIVPRKAYKSQEEFRDVYSRQPREVFEYTLTPQ